MKEICAFLSSVIRSLPFYFLNLDLKTTIKPPMQIPVKAIPATKNTEFIMMYTPHSWRYI